jgi:carotenoid biosynthesis protein
MRMKLFVLYLLLLAGGMWNLLGFFTETMVLLAAPMIIGLGLWVLVEFNLEQQKRGRDSDSGNRFLVWTLTIIISTFLIEAIGVHTGVIFGKYSYGDTLQPQLGSVPFAIGFAWFTMIMSSVAVVMEFEDVLRGKPVLLLSAAIAIVMTGFDALMEPAAQALRYWQWEGGTIPAQNFVAWFVISFLLVFLGMRLKALPITSFRFGTHVFAAQLGYFLLTAIGAWTNG